MKRGNNMYFFKFCIPLAQGFVSDDMGWFHSSDLTGIGGPPRLHSDHSPNIEDYRELVRLSKTCGTRIMTAFVMSEADMNSICGKPQYNRPLAPMDITEYGTDWHNSVTEDQKAIMAYIRENSACMDFALHGVRHGHFGSGEWEVGEWARRAKKDEKGNFCEDIKTVTPWDEENITDRLTAECYRELIRQYYTEEELPFPESFVPPNHSYYFEKGKENTTGAVLSQYGVKYCNFKNTGSGSGDYDFDPIVNWDHNICILDRRGLKNCSYKKTGATPKLPPRPFPWIEVHFNNLWGQTDHFAKYLYSINRYPARMLARNTEQVYSQWLYRNFAKITQKGNSFSIDCTQIPREAYDNNILSNITLKIYLGKREIETVTGEAELLGYHKDRYGRGYITLGDSSANMGRLHRKIYNFTYKTGRTAPSFYLDTDRSFFSLYGAKDNRISLKVYGTETVRIKTEKQHAETRGAKLLDSQYTDGFLCLTLRAKSMLGDTTEILLK